MENSESEAPLYESALSQNPTVLVIKKSAPSKKRCAESDSDIQTKRVKMDENNITDVISKAVAAANSNVTETITTALTPVTKALEQLTNHQIETDKRLDKMEIDLKCMKESIDVGQITKEVREEVARCSDSKTTSAHKLYLAGQVEKAATNLIIHGMTIKDPLTDVESLISQIGIPSGSTPKIKSAYSLRNVKNNIGSVHVSFETSFIRNDVLRYAKNLPSGISFEKDIPPAYRRKNKAFKRQAYKLRKWHGAVTTITFLHHLMQLKYRDPGVDSNGKPKSWVIYDEFFPDVDETLRNQNVGPASEGSPSKAISKALIEKAGRTFCIPNLKNLSKADTENLIAKIGTNFVELVEEIIVKDHFTLVRCKEEGSVEKVVNECKKLKNGSELLKCELFLDP